MQKQKTNKRKEFSPNTIAIFGSILAILGGFFLSYNYLEEKKIYAHDQMGNLLYKEEEPKETVVEEKEEEVEPVQEEVKVETIVNKNEYLGYLEIPKINLLKGFYDKTSPLNDVEKNIMVMPESSYPDVDRGNLIISGHSGTGWKAFFDNLEKLNKGDELIVKYNNKKYTYQLTNIYEVEKDGTVAIYRNYNKTTLTLITCTNNIDTSQSIYIAELISVE